jgi:hypothetical protein
VSGGRRDDDAGDADSDDDDGGGPLFSVALARLLQLRRRLGAWNHHH